MKTQAAAFRIAIIGMTLVQVACGRAQGPSATVASPSAVATLTPNSPAWFLSGPIYREPPDFALASAVLRAATSKRATDAAVALQSIFGQGTVSKERTALASVYGSSSVDVFFAAFSEVLRDLGREPGLPQTAKPTTGAVLGSAIIKAGTDNDGYFYTGYMLDHLMGHATAFQIIRKIRANPSFGPKSIASINSVSNRFFYDMSRTLELRGVRLATSGWTPSAGMHTVAARGDTVQFVYYGRSAGSPEYVARIVPVTPGNLYRFSAFVDPSGILAGEFDLKIDRVDGVATYSSVFHGAGHRGIFMTPDWVCPAGVHEALLVMQVLGATVRSGARLTFSQPRFQGARSL